MDETVLNFILLHLTTIILELYADPSLPRSNVQNFIDKFDFLLKTIILPCISNDMKNILISGVAENTETTNEDDKKKKKDQIKKKIEQCIIFYSNVLEKVNTESKRLTILQEKGFEDPLDFLIGSDLVQTDLDDPENDHFVSGPRKYGFYVPLKKSLKMFLEIPGMFSSILTYLHELSQAKLFIKNCMQAELWSKTYSDWGDFIHSSGNSITLPLLIYFDEFVAGSALGANAAATKFGAVYASILCLPPSIASKLSSILFSTIFKAKHLSEFGNSRVFSKLIEDINLLSSEGIEIVFKREVKKIFFKCIMVIGDNLGLNSIFGMIASFNTDYCCRICKATKAQIHSMVEEDKELLRNKENYDADVESNEPEKTGVRERSIFNSINGFHICINYTIDLMHDIMEGMANYVMTGLITVWIKKGYFTLRELNSQIKKFNFGNSNRPTKIKIDPATKEVKIKMSASQMRNFVHFFGCLIGHRIKKISEEDIDAWHLYKSLKWVLMLVTSPKVTSGTPSQLKEAIKILCSLYIKLFGHLKFKFHLLIHYPEILKRFGPLVHFWCMRYESRHRLLKAASNSVSGSKNILKSVAIKEILRLCFSRHTQEVSDQIIFGPRDHSFCNTQVLSSISEDVLSNAIFHTKVTVYEEEFQIGSIVVINVASIKKVFGKITKIIDSNKDIYFTCEIFEMYFDENATLGYAAKNIGIKTFKFSDVPICGPCMMHEINSNIVVSSENVL